MRTPEFDKGYEFLKQKDYHNAFCCFRLAAYSLDYDLNAIAYMGYCYQFGYGVTQDPCAAARWYEFALSLGGEKWKNSWVGQRYNSLVEKHRAQIQKDPLNFFNPIIGKIICVRGDGPIMIRVINGCVYYYGYKDKYAETVESQVITNFRERRYKRDYSKFPKVIDENYHCDHDHFKLRITRGKGSAYTHTTEGDIYTIVVPHNTVFEQLAVRETILNYAKRLVSVAANDYLPKRIKELSQTTNLPFGRVKVKAMKGALGMFFRKGKNIYLHPKLILCKSKEIDSVIVHELCHVVSFDHNSKFREAMIQYGGKELSYIDERGISTNSPLEYI